MPDAKPVVKVSSPDSEDKSAAKPVAKVAPKAAPVAKSTSKNKFVLVAEDDKFYGQIFKTKLGKDGVDVVVATDRAKALKAARERTPNLILLDLVMPVKDGFETLQELKADANLKNVPVIVLSNLGQDSDVEKAKKMGAKDYLIKSNVSIQEVVEMAKKYLG